MVSLQDLQATASQLAGMEYRCRTDLNLYDGPDCTRLATQAAIGRHLRLTRQVQPDASAVEVQLCEDDYPGWMSLSDLALIEATQVRYQPIARSLAEIQAQLPAAIAFTQQAMTQPNYYLWGGTVGPNYDCSGLMQAAFAAVGIWLPRDAYQQETFTQAISLSALQPGDLVFFGTLAKATHVGLYLGNGRYIHSSGKAQGRDGIGIDSLSDQGDAVSQAYFAQLRGAGRVVASYGADFQH